MHTRRAVRLSALAAAGVTVVWSAGIASAAPIAVSHNPSPYATTGCTALDAPQTAFGSLNYRNSEVEPEVAVDPTNAQHLVGVWQQDRWSDGGAHGLVAAYSTNGGATWTPSPQPFTACYHASGFVGPFLDYQRASDPWVSIGPGTPRSSGSGSTVYSVSLSIDVTPYPGDPDATHSAVGAAASYDGGATWSNVQQIIADPCLANSINQPGYVCGNSNAFVSNDKESVTADPVHPGVAYAVWDRLVAPPASPAGIPHERAFAGPALLSKTTDYGQHWSQPRIIVGLASQDQTIGNQIVVNRQTGVLYDFFNLIHNASNRLGQRGSNVAFVSSRDGGATWSTPVVVSPSITSDTVDAANVDPTTGTPPAPSRTGDDIPEVSISPTTGQLYVVWQDSRFSSTGTDQVVLSTSSNGGTTWSTPSVVSSPTGGLAYDPSVAVDATGRVAVSYFQWGRTVLGNEPTQLFIRHSQAPGSSTTPPGFDGPTALDGPFNNLAAPFAGGYFLGDYQGLVAGRTGFVPFYVKTRCADGGADAEPSCRALTSVLPPGDATPTNANSTDVYARPGS